MSVSENCENLHPTKISHYTVLFIVQSEVMRFGRQNSDDSAEEEMYERGESELTATRLQLPRKVVSEAAPMPAKRVSI